MSATTESKQDNTKAAEHAAAKADVKVELQKKATELAAELEQIDGQIQELELQAAQEVDEARVLELLSERTRLETRKQALPFLLRGAQSRVLHRQSAALQEEADALKADLDAVEVEVGVATKRIPELQKELDQALAVLSEAEGRRYHLASQHQNLMVAAGSARANARCIERGEPMKF